jgi:hypothetical protein
MIQAFVYVCWQLCCSEAVYLSACCRLLLSWDAVFLIEAIFLEKLNTFDAQSGSVRTVNRDAKSKLYLIHITGLWGYIITLKTHTVLSVPELLSALYTAKQTNSHSYHCWTATALMTHTSGDNTVTD